MSRYRALFIIGVLAVLISSLFLQAGEAQRNKVQREAAGSRSASKTDSSSSVNKTDSNAQAGQSTTPLVELRTPKTGTAVRSGESAPARTLSAPSRFTDESQEDREVNELNSGDQGTPNPNAKSAPDGALQSSLPRRQSINIPGPSLNFEGLSAADNTTAFGTTFAPPDPTGAVGPNDYVQTTNDLVRIYDKFG